MMIGVAEVILMLASVYTALGVVIGTAFVVRGVDVVDASAAGAPWSFRVLVLPGAVALWPVVLRWWLRRRGEQR